MSPTDPGRFVTAATAKPPAEPPISPPSGGSWAWIPDKAASGATLAISPPPSEPVHSQGADPLPEVHSRTLKPFDDPCNYLG